MDTQRQFANKAKELEGSRGTYHDSNEIPRWNIGLSNPIQTLWINIEDSNNIVNSLATMNLSNLAITINSSKLKRPKLQQGYDAK